MISRRRFLLASAATAAGMLLSPSINALQGNSISFEYFLIGDGARGNASLFGLAPYSSQPGSVRIWRWGQNGVLEIKLPFFPHSFASHPGTPHRVTVFEKWGRHLAEIDLATMTVVRITQAKPDRRFFGHGAHSGQFIYATQMDDKNGHGLVSVIDSADHKMVHEFETQGAFPHDCQWLPGSNTLLIVNSRRSGAQKSPPDNFSSLVWMDANTGKCCGFNPSMQHTKLCESERSVADETKTSYPLHGNPEGYDVGSLAERGFPPADCTVV